MALKDEIREQIQSLKGKGVKAHVSWFLTYYSGAVIVTVIVALFLVFFIRRIVTGKERIFGIVMINAYTVDLFSDTDSGQEISENFSEYAGIDTSKYYVHADLNERLDISEDMDFQTVERIFALSASNQLDVLTADREVYDYYANAQSFEDLRGFLPAEELESLENKGLLYYSDALDEKGSLVESHVPTGVVCTGSKALKEVGAYEGKECITGIIAGTRHPDTAVIFIQYLLQ